MNRKLFLLLGMFLTVISWGKDSSKDPWEISKIHHDNYESEKYGKDYIVFKNGKKLKDLGYKVESIGKIKVGNNPPVHLFKALTCIECEPGVELIVYSPKTQQRVVLPHPVSTDGIDAETMDNLGVIFRVTGFFGKCSGEYQGIFLVKESRDVVSEKGKKALSKSWQPVSIHLKVKSTGALEKSERAVTRTHSDGLKNHECKEIKVVQTHDYI